MKISKSRLLQIIREEVELHEKNIFEFDEKDLSELTDKEEKDAIKREIQKDKAVGNLEEENVESQEEMPKEDQILRKNKKNSVIQPRNLK